MRAFAVLLLALCCGCAQPPDPLNHYDEVESKRMVPLLREAIAFQTSKGNDAAFSAQKAWLTRTARDLEFEVRDAGTVMEIELPGPAGAPVLGLLVHGDVQPVGEGWSVPPFQGVVKDGVIYGRGVADDKGPLVQSLLAMSALKNSKVERTHTIRLLVGSDEESDNEDVTTYLKSHRPPDMSLVLDFMFPLSVGEKAWNGLFVSIDGPLSDDPSVPYKVREASGGLDPSIVPDRAQVVLRWLEGKPDWGRLVETLGARSLPEGVTMEIVEEGATLTIRTLGKAAHSGMNITAGRNAIVGLAKAVDGLLPRGGVADLLAFSLLTPEDLGVAGSDPLWGTNTVNVGFLGPNDSNHLELQINIRSIPPRSGEELRAHLENVVTRFNETRGAALHFDGYFKSAPLRIDPRAPTVQRLLSIYEKATGEQAAPYIAGGSSYAKRVPNSIAFGMWFPSKPYPGHDLDEAIPIEDLHRGARVLIHALADIACGPVGDLSVPRLPND